MKDKFIRVISPLSLLIVIILDIGVIAYGIFAVKNLTQKVTTLSIIFAVCIVVAVIVAVLTTRETVRNGVIFRENEMEFTGLDSDNVFKYEDIEKISYVKDEKPSFVKNFLDRQSRIIITFKDDKVITVDIGLTTKNKLKEIEKEITQRIENIKNENE